MTDNLETYQLARDHAHRNTIIPPQAIQSGKYFTHPLSFRI
jgi:hypothetical protein